METVEFKRLSKEVENANALLLQCLNQIDSYVWHYNECVLHGLPVNNNCIERLNTYKAMKPRLVSFYEYKVNKLLKELKK